MRPNLIVSLVLLLGIAVFFSFHHSRPVPLPTAKASSGSATPSPLLSERPPAWKEWREFKAPDGSFRCMLPGEPESSSHWNADKDPKVQVALMAICPGPGKRVKVEWRKAYHPNSHPKREAVLTALRNRGGKVLSRGRVTGLESADLFLEGPHAVAWSPGSGSVNDQYECCYTRVIVAHDRNYWLELAYSTKAIADPKEVRKLFDSFHPLAGL